MDRIERIEQKIQEHQTDIYSLNRELEIATRVQTQIKDIFSRMYEGEIQISHEDNTYCTNNNYYVDMKKTKRTPINGTDILGSKEINQLKKIGLRITCVGKDYFYVDSL